MKKIQNLNEKRSDKDANLITNINFEAVMTLTGHTNSVNSLLLLKDNRIASCSDDKTIRIYSPFNNYYCTQVLNRHSDYISSICELDNGTIVSCSYDLSIMIDDYTIKNAHDLCINKVITLSNNRIASCSDDNTIKIWKSDPPYSDTPIKVLEGHNNLVTSILYIKERDIMISCSYDRTFVWNMSTYQCVTVLTEVKCTLSNALFEIDKDRILVGCNSQFFIVNIDKCVIEKTIKDKSQGYVKCFLKLRDNKTILCGCSNGIIGVYDMKTEEYKITKNNYKSEITDLLLIDKNHFMSSFNDSTIKVWKY